MTAAISAVCRLTTEIPRDAFRSESDVFRNGVLVSPRTLDRLGIEPFDYVRVKPATDSADWSDAIYLQATPLVDGFDHRDSETDPAVVGMRTHVLRAVDEALAPGDTVQLRGVDVPVSDELAVKRSYADERSGERCYISRELRTDLGVNWGGSVEIFHPETGGRITVPAWPLKQWDPQDAVAIDLHSREVLGVETGDAVRVQRPVPGWREASTGRLGTPLSGAKKAFLNLFIGCRTISLRVYRGLNRDEHRNIVRINEGMMTALGMEPGDMAILRWKGRRQSVQFLPPPDDGAVPPLSVKLPSTERDQIDVSVGDAVKTHRDMGYVFKKNVALSIFGVLGVVIGILNVVDALSLVDRYAGTVGYGNLILALTVASVLVSVIVVWIVLYPERQKATTTDPRE